MKLIEPTYSSEHFYGALNTNEATITRVVADALRGALGGELFLETTRYLNLRFEESILKDASYTDVSGFGLRRVGDGAQAPYVYGDTLHMKYIKEAAKNVRALTPGKRRAKMPAEKIRRQVEVYPPVDPLGEQVQSLVVLMQEIDNYARSIDERVKDVTINITGAFSLIMIVRSPRHHTERPIVTDIRPLIRMDLSLLLEEDGVRRQGQYGFGGREDFGRIKDPLDWKFAVRSALSEASDMLHAKPCPAGEMPIVLAPGWPAILFHESIGHPLEGDFAYQKSSPFSEMMGKKIASSCVTVIDDGTIPWRRGSLSVDDEGNTTAPNILIKDGVLVGFLHDSTSRRMLGASYSRSGRRQSYAHPPQPRMTNTYMQTGTDNPDDIIRSVKEGIYVKNFSGGMVDQTTTKFVFEARGAWRIEDGAIAEPVVGVALRGSGMEALKHIRRVGTDFALDSGVGVCGKCGQGVPVGVGMPTTLIDGGIIVSGTEF